MVIGRYWDLVEWPLKGGFHCDNSVNCSIGKEFPLQQESFPGSKQVMYF